MGATRAFLAELDRHTLADMTVRSLPEVSLGQRPARAAGNDGTPR
jgi:hypothetical protein